MSKRNFDDKCMISDYNSDFEYFVNYYDETATVKAVIKYRFYYLVFFEHTEPYGDDVCIDLFISDDRPDAVVRAFYVTRGELGSKDYRTVRDVFSTLCRMAVKRYDGHSDADMYVQTSPDDNTTLCITTKNIELKLAEAFVKAGLPIDERMVDTLYFGSLTKNRNILSILLARDKGKLLTDLAALIDKESEDNQ